MGLVNKAALKFFFKEKGCANFSTPYTAHPPTRSETTVTQRVGMKRKEFEKHLTLKSGSVRYAPLTARRESGERVRNAL